MCRRRHVNNVFLMCGHTVPLPETIIQCDNRFCRFSSVHPANCIPPRCTQTCAQYRLFPEQYSPNINGFCPNCVQHGRH